MSHRQVILVTSISCIYSNLQCIHEVSGYVMCLWGLPQRRGLGMERLTDRQLFLVIAVVLRVGWEVALLPASHGR